MCKCDDKPMKGKGKPESGKSGKPFGKGAAGKPTAKPKGKGKAKGK